MQHTSVASTSTPEPPPQIDRRVRWRDGRGAFARGAAAFAFFVAFSVVVIGGVDVLFLVLPMATLQGRVTSVEHHRKHRVDVDVDLGDRGFVTVDHVDAVVGDNVSVDVVSVGGHVFARAAGVTRGPFPLVFGALVLLILGWSVVRSALDWWTVRYGPADGTFTNVTTRTGKGGRRVTVAFDYVVDGVTRSSTVTLKEAVWLRRNVGGDVTVFHHPRWARVAVVASLSDWIVVVG